MSCPQSSSQSDGQGAVSCSGHGQCLTVSLIAEKLTQNGVLAGITYGTDPNNPATWDANKVQGKVSPSANASAVTLPHLWLGSKLRYVRLLM